MKSISYFLLTVFACSIFYGCNNRTKHSEKQNDTRTTQVSELSQKDKFPFPEIPTTITAQEERKAFLLEHLWDNFDFTDTALVKNRDIIEQGFSKQIALLNAPSINTEALSSSIQRLCSAMEKSELSRHVFMDLFDDYLFDPNSPCYNENIYAVYLQRMTKSNFLSEAEKSRLNFRLKLISRNRPGEEATSFTY